MSRVALQIIGFLGMALGLLMVAHRRSMPSGSAGADGDDLWRIYGVQPVYEHGAERDDVSAVGRNVPDLDPRHRRGICGFDGEAGAVLGTFFFPILKAQIGIPTLLLGWP